MGEMHFYIFDRELLLCRCPSKSHSNNITIFVCRYSTLLDLDSSALNHSSVSGLFRLNKSSYDLCMQPCLLFHYGFAQDSLFAGPDLQQVYMYFRGSGKAAEMKREATTRTMMAAL